MLSPPTNERSDFALEWVREAEPLRNPRAPAEMTNERSDFALEWVRNAEPLRNSACAIPALSRHG